MRRLLITVLLSVLSSTAHADTSASLATDLSPWFLDGYSAIAMVEPNAVPGLRLTAEFWGMQMPSAVLELGPENRGEGWQRKFTHAVALYGDWHPSKDGTSWHVGGILNFLASRLSRDGLDEVGRMQSAEVLVRGGYRWFPFSRLGLFVDPWVAAGYIFPVGPRPTVGGEKFVEFPLQVVGTIHLGWRFGP